MSVIIQQYLKEKQAEVDMYLDTCMPRETDYPPILHQSMRYTLFSVGKRFRPILAIAACEACGGDFDAVISSACALEVIHAYSLIHDDLPAMDNDDYRRGKLTNHRKFGEDIAVLAGDALLSFAFELLDGRVVRDVARAIGSCGVVGGQVVDMQLARKEFPLDFPVLEYIHTHKTGKLIAIACKVGAILSGASEEMVDAVYIYGKHIGFAFQIIDDVLDNDNYAVLLGGTEARKKAMEQVEIGNAALSCLPESRRETLCALAHFVVSRTE